MRNQEWLESRLEYIYRKYFFDLQAPNQIHIRFGRRSRTRLGSIDRKYGRGLVSRLRNDYATVITINGLFCDEAIPLFVLDAVITHELSHYAHGFNSPLPQRHQHPHKGGVIRKELKKRDLAALEKHQKKWMKENWAKYLKKNFPGAPRRRRRRIRYVIVRP